MSKNNVGYFPVSRKFELERLGYVPLVDEYGDHDHMIGCGDVYYYGYTSPNRPIVGDMTAREQSVVDVLEKIVNQEGVKFSSGDGYSISEDVMDLVVQRLSDFSINYVSMRDFKPSKAS